MKKIVIFALLIPLILLIVACSPIQELTQQVEEKIVTKYQCMDGTFVDDPEDCPKPTVKENGPTSDDDIKPAVINQKGDKCPKDIEALRYSEATDNLISYLKTNTNPHLLLSGDEEGLIYQKDSLFGNGAIYLYFEYRGLPSENTFGIYKAYSKKDLNSKFNTDSPSINYGEMRPGRTEGVYKTEDYFDKNADGLIDTVTIFSCEGYDVCDYDLGLYDKKSYTRLESAKNREEYWPEMVESYEGEYAGNFVLLSNLFECPFTITTR